MSDIHKEESRGWPVLDLVASKLVRPLLRPGTVDRSSLIERRAHGDSYPIISVAAPAGCRKTTMLAQWAECDGRAFAWVSVDEAGNDPKSLLAYIAAARDGEPSRRDELIPGTSTAGGVAAAGRDKRPMIYAPPANWLCVRPCVTLCRGRGPIRKG